MLNNLTFNRESLAQAFCDSLTGSGITDARSGLFLAGPRRVGKSTFLLEDLIPQASERGWHSIYVDLWSNKLADPATLITEVIKASIAEQETKVGKLAKRLQLQKINILKTIELDFTKPGIPENITLAQLLSLLIELIGKPILLVIDEAQHALTSPNGINTMFAIKSARDQINKTGEAPQLMLVLTGSNRDKLAQLVIKKDQPFFGSDITSFPLLGRDFTDFFTEKINHALASNNNFSEDSVWDAFQLIGYRPEILRQLVGQIAIRNEAQSLSSLLKQDASIWHSQIWNEYENDFNALLPLHRTVLTLLIKQGRSWSPFSDESMQYYKRMLDQPNLSVSSVQTAIQLLREKDFIWQSSRGAYALEDEGFAQWFLHTQKS